MSDSARNRQQREHNPEQQPPPTTPRQHVREMEEHLREMGEYLRRMGERLRRLDEQLSHLEAEDDRAADRGRGCPLEDSTSLVGESSARCPRLYPFPTVHLLKGTGSCKEGPEPGMGLHKAFRPLRTHLLPTPGRL